MLAVVGLERIKDISWEKLKSFISVSSKVWSRGKVVRNLSGLLFAPDVDLEGLLVRGY